MPPLVSVCILTFNGESFVGEAINSVIQQTFKNLEVLIVDNCSSDSTLTICNQLQDTHSRISIQQTEMPLGISGGLNHCLKLAKGEYVKFLMQDDILEPTCIEKMLAAFAEFPSATLVGCAEQLISETGEFIKVSTSYKGSGLMSGCDTAKEILYKLSNTIGTPTSVLLKRESCSSGFNRSMFLFEDVELYLRVLLTGDYYFIDEPLSKVRVHGKTGSAINSNTMVFISDMLQLKEMFASFLEQYDIPKEEWSKIVDTHILAYAGHMLSQEGVTEDSARAYAHKLKELVGYDYTEQLLESMTRIIFYAFSRLFKVELESNWNAKENQRLAHEMNLMSESLPFKMTQPLRDFKLRFFNTKI